LGYPVKYFDKYANPTSKTTAKQVDANVTVSSIADKYIAIGGKKMRKFNTLNSDATAKSRNGTFKTIQGKGGKLWIMAGNSMQKIALTEQKVIRLHRSENGFTRRYGFKIC
jgi:hypothetical protein